MAEGSVAGVLAVDAQFFGIDHFVVIFFRIWLRGKQPFLVGESKRVGTRVAGFDVQDDPVFSFKLAGLRCHIGSRAHEAHLAFQDVPQLGQLVDLAPSQKPSKGSDAAVAFKCDARFLITDPHTAKLENSEWLALVPNAYLTEKDGARH